MSRAGLILYIRVIPAADISVFDIETKRCPVRFRIGEAGNENRAVLFAAGCASRIFSRGTAGHKSLKSFKIDLFSRREALRAAVYPLIMGGAGDLNFQFFPLIY